MKHKILALLSAVSFGVFLYYWHTGGVLLNEVFLPVGEGVITTGIIIFSLVYRKAKKALIKNKITYVPIFVSLFFLLLCVLIYLTSNPSGSENIIYTHNESNQMFKNNLFNLLMFLFFPLGALGLPLGIINSYIWPLLTSIGYLPSIFALLLLPTTFIVSEIKQIVNLYRTQNLTTALSINIFYPLLILLLLLPILFLFSLKG